MRGTRRGSRSGGGREGGRVVDGELRESGKDELMT